MACGTGHHISFLKKKFKCWGADLNKPMLDIAKKKHSGVTFRKANMTSFKFPKKFDIITCLFSSIGYVKTEKNLRATIRCFSKHLKPGGIMIIEGWLEKRDFKPGRPSLLTYQSDDLKIARANVARLNGLVTIMDMHHLIAERGKPVKHIVSREEVAMFPAKSFIKYMKEQGLITHHIKKGPMGRGIYIGVRPK